MKRYLLFAGDTYYPRGGMRDLKGDFEYLTEAKLAAAEGESMIGNEGSGYDWWHVFDTQEMCVVANGGSTPFARAETF